MTITERLRYRCALLVALRYPSWRMKFIPAYSLGSPSDGESILVEWSDSMPFLPKWEDLQDWFRAYHLLRLIQRLQAKKALT